MKVDNFLILGVKISILNYRTTLKILSKYIDNNKKGYVCVSAVHLIMECVKDDDLRKGVNKSIMTTADGMPLLWIQRYLGKFKNAERVYGPELTLKLCQLSEKNGYRIYLLGGSVGESKKLKKILISKYPKLKIVGHTDTPLRTISEINNTKIIFDIKKKNPDIIFIGLGCPFQERWMIENRNKIDSSILIGVGAAFDILTKKSKQAPLWIQKYGFEWFYRFVQDPQRLWYRYTVLNVLFIVVLIQQVISQKLIGNRHE